VDIGILSFHVSLLYTVLLFCATGCRTFLFGVVERSTMNPLFANIVECVNKMSGKGARTNFCKVVAICNTSRCHW
jgi:hypothetical protein